jgi:hypothetical protein
LLSIAPSPCAKLCSSYTPPAAVYCNVLAIKRHNGVQTRDLTKESPGRSHLDGYYPVRAKHHAFS